MIPESHSPESEQLHLTQENATLIPVFPGDAKIMHKWARECAPCEPGSLQLACSPDADTIALRLQSPRGPVFYHVTADELSAALDQLVLGDDPVETDDADPGDEAKNSDLVHRSTRAVDAPAKAAPAPRASASAERPPEPDSGPARKGGPDGPAADAPEGAPAAAPARRPRAAPPVDG